MTTQYLSAEDIDNYGPDLINVTPEGGAAGGGATSAEP